MATVAMNARCWLPFKASGTSSIVGSCNPLQREEQAFSLQIPAETEPVQVFSLRTNPATQRLPSHEGRLQVKAQLSVFNFGN